MIVSEKTNKSQYWQMIRGICILAVIMILCPNAIGLKMGNFSVWLVLRQLINFPYYKFLDVLSVDGLRKLFISVWC